MKLFVTNYNSTKVSENKFLVVNLYNTLKGLDDEFIQTLREIDVPSKKELKVGTTQELFYNDLTDTFFYDYVDISKPQEELQAERITQLENAIMETTMLLATEQQRNIQNEQAIMELSTLIAGGM